MLRMSYTHRSVCSVASELDESCEKEEEFDRENRGLGMGGKWKRIDASTGDHRQKPWYFYSLIFF